MTPLEIIVSALMTLTAGAVALTINRLWNRVEKIESRCIGEVAEVATVKADVRYCREGVDYLRGRIDALFEGFGNGKVTFQKQTDGATGCETS